MGSLEPRKNIPFLLQALAEAKVQDLGVVLGGGSAAEQENVLRLAAGLGLGKQVLTVGRIDDGDLPAFYAQAYTFVYPSEYEGFGLQICEAMAAGCPVLAARASCFPEILGTGGDIFSIADSSELAGSLRKICENEEYRAELKARALHRSESFSWSGTARGTADLYERLCSDPGRSTRNPGGRRRASSLVPVTRTS